MELVHEARRTIPSFESFSLPHDVNKAAMTLTSWLQHLNDRATTSCSVTSHSHSGIHSLSWYMEELKRMKIAVDKSSDETRSKRRNIYVAKIRRTKKNYFRNQAELQIRKGRVLESDQAEA